MSGPAQSTTFFAMALGDNDGRPIGGVRDITAKAFSSVLCCHTRTVAASLARRNRKSSFVRRTANYVRFTQTESSALQSFASPAASVALDPFRRCAAPQRLDIEGGRRTLRRVDGLSQIQNGPQSRRSLPLSIACSHGLAHQSLKTKAAPKGGQT